MINVNQAPYRDYTCAVCLEDTYTAAPGTPGSNGIVWDCGHALHIACAHNAEQVRRITECFLCRQRVNREALPPLPIRDKLNRAYQTGFTKSPDEMREATRTIMLGTIVGSTYLSGFVGWIAARAFGAAALSSAAFSAAVLSGATFGTVVCGGAFFALSSADFGGGDNAPMRHLVGTASAATTLADHSLRATVWSSVRDMRVGSAGLGVLAIGAALYAGY